MISIYTGEWCQLHIVEIFSINEPIESVKPFEHIIDNFGNLVSLICVSGHEIYISMNYHILALKNSRFVIVIRSLNIIDNYRY